MVNLALFLDYLVLEGGILVTEDGQLYFEPTRILILDQDVDLVGFPLVSHIGSVGFILRHA